MEGNVMGYLNTSQHPLGGAEVNHEHPQDNCFPDPEKDRGYMQVDLLNHTCPFTHTIDLEEYFPVSFFVNLSGGC
jgi:hypothetical protein